MCYLTWQELASGRPTGRRRKQIAPPFGGTSDDRRSLAVKNSLRTRDYIALGDFRYAMRRFLRFSMDLIAAQARLTPEQYEALLAIKASEQPDGVTVGEISERLQVRHHTAVSLLNKLEARKLALRRRTNADRRTVNVQLTKAGASLLSRLVLIHYSEIRRHAPDMISALRRLQNKNERSRGRSSLRVNVK
jgi:DNA-binding MarR family transcriptional regulator